MSIRPAITNDVSPLLSLVQGYYHDSPVPLTIDESAMAAHLNQLRTDATLGALLVAELDQQLVGFAILYRSFDTRTLKPLLIINDVYVAPKFRRHGLARQLMQAAVGKHGSAIMAPSICMISLASVKLAGFIMIVLAKINLKKEPSFRLFTMRFRLIIGRRTCLFF